MALAQAVTAFQQQTLKQHQQPKDPFGVRRATDRSLEHTGAKGQSRQGSQISSSLGWGKKVSQKSCPRNSLKSIKAVSAQP